MNKPDWEEKFDEKFNYGFQCHNCFEMDGEEIKAFIRELLEVQNIKAKQIYNAIEVMSKVKAQCADELEELMRHSCELYEKEGYDFLYEDLHNLIKRWRKV